MEKMRMETENLVEENIKKLMQLFPSVVTETVKDGKVERAVDFDALKQELSEVVVEGNEERYQFTWPDKKKARLLANTPVRATLRPCKEESVDFDSTQNLYIEGDNLDVLKLVRETYLGKIKMIYIDPPYNTGNDFVYEDNFAMSVEEYSQIGGDYDEQGNRLVQNTSSNGRLHTDWLNMIYPRIKVSRDLLADDGVIFISIDDRENSNLKKICDEVFGSDNFICDFPRVTKRGGKSTDDYAKNHDYVICYCKDSNNAVISGVTHVDEGFKNRDEFYEMRGPYKLNQTLDYNTLQYSETMDYPIEVNGRIYVPGGDMEAYNQRHNGVHGKHDWVWRWSKDLFDFGYQNGWIEISKSGRIYTKTYLNASISKNDRYFIEYKERTKPISTLEFVDNIYSNDNSLKDIKKIMDSAVFDYVKPVSLLLTLLKTVTDRDSMVLDFFSGSATTAHAVMQLNAEDNGKRKFIMVQLPEKCAEGTEAYKAGYKNICEIGKERIRRAGKKMKEDAGLALQSLDVGFRVLKLDSSNMKDVYYKPDETRQQKIDDILSNVKEDRTSMDLLFQVMLEKGTLLSSKINEKVVEGKTVYVVNDNDLICCFDNDIGDDVVKAISQMKPLYAVFRDSSFRSDDTLVNAEQYFRTYSPNTELGII